MPSFSISFTTNLGSVVSDLERDVVRALESGTREGLKLPVEHIHKAISGWDGSSPGSLWTADQGELPVNVEVTGSTVHGEVGTEESLLTFIDTGGSTWNNDNQDKYNMVWGAGTAKTGNSSWSEGSRRQSLAGRRRIKARNFFENAFKDTESKIYATIEDALGSVI